MLSSNAFVGGKGRDYAKHLVITAVRGSMHVEQYNSSVQFNRCACRGDPRLMSGPVLARLTGSDPRMPNILVQTRKRPGAPWLTHTIYAPQFRSEAARFASRLAASLAKGDIRVIESDTAARP